MRAEMTSRLWLVTLAVLLGCSEAGPTCGPGTVAKAGRCVASGQALACGTGTVLDKGVCVLVSDAAGDSAGGQDTLSDTVPVDTGLPDSGGGCGAGCPKGQTCSPDGQCVSPGIPAAWSCAPTAFSDGEVCDCACGAIDPDCVNPTLPVLHCSSGQCAPDGTCAACVPACTGKTCGPDGCGSECGQCLSPDAPFCQGGQCKAVCVPACSGKTCGPDGCGGSCGACGDGETCTFGQCGAIAPEDSCLGHCGGKAPGGCGCDGGCSAAGNCCADFTNTCGCVPSCKGNTCGEDGCGGVCGTCAAGEVCVGGSCDVDPCDPDPCATHGSCDATTGACACSEGFGGTGCSQCAPGYGGYPTCVPDLCAGKGKTCSQHGTCVAATGECDCDAGFSGPDCGACAPGQGTWPTCTDPCAGKPNCDDGNACTEDSCSKSAGCVHAPTVAGCDDGNACTLGDLCTNGTCQGGGKVCDFAVNAKDDVDDGTCDAKHCSLREAIAASNAKGSGGIGLAIDGPIVLTSALPIVVVPLTVLAPGKAVAIDGGGKFRIFRGQANLALGNVILQAGAGGVEGGGGVWMESGDLTLQAVTVQGCSADGNGAGVLAMAGLTVTDSRFTGNQATGSGGAMFADGSLTVTRTLFSANTSVSSGGAVACSISSVATITRSAFLDGKAATGGGLYVQGKATVANVTFVGNSASLNGGAIASPGAVTVVHCSLYANESPNVAGILATGTLDLRNTLIGGTVGQGADCAATVLNATVNDLIEDGSCNALLQGPVGLGALGSCGGMPVLTLLATSPGVDAGDGGACTAAPVAGVDQCGVKRPAGAACDIGAMESIAP
jgi:CSLREA domain-containing protein